MCKRLVRNSSDLKIHILERHCSEINSIEKPSGAEDKPPSRNINPIDRANFEFKCSLCDTEFRTRSRV